MLSDPHLALGLGFWMGGLSGGGGQLIQRPMGAHLCGSMPRVIYGDSTSFNQ